jgi:hypothetical protein
VPINTGWILSVWDVRRSVDLICCRLAVKVRTKGGDKINGEPSDPYGTKWGLNALLAK